VTKRVRPTCQCSGCVTFVSLLSHFSVTFVSLSCHLLALCCHLYVTFMPRLCHDCVRFVSRGGGRLQVVVVVVVVVGIAAVGVMTDSPTTRWIKTGLLRFISETGSDRREVFGPFGVFCYVLETYPTVHGSWRSDIIHES